MVVQAKNPTLDICLHDLQVRFPVASGTVKAADGVNIVFKHSQVMGIIGESGCGKSVLGQAVLGILPDYVEKSGRIIYRGKDILNSAAALYGREIALIPQNPAAALNPLRRIGKQFDDIIAVVGWQEHRAALKRQWLEFFGLTECERILAAYPHELSGGMLQRVLCAMSVCCQPNWLLADEPTKGLDERIGAVVYSNLVKIKREQRMGMLLITHDLALAAAVCDNIAVMYAGQIIEYGPQRRILTEPRHPYTQAFMAALPENGLKMMAGLAPSSQEQLRGCRFAPRCQYSCERCHNEIPPFYNNGAGQARCFIYVGGS